MSEPVHIQTVHQELERATAAGDPPSAACCVIRAGVGLHDSAHGDATIDSLFDIASVTKVVATTASIACLIRDGHLTLDDVVKDHLEELRHPSITVRELLAHRSGLPAWRPFFVTAKDRAALVAELFAVELERPIRRVYSDLGFLVLGLLVGRVSGVPLDEYAARELFVPLSLDLAFNAHRLTGRHVLPTGTTRPREPAPGQAHLYEVPPQPPRQDPGFVDDDNAFVMGGVAGHAGVFGTASAVARFGAALLEEIDGAAPLGLGEVLRDFFVRDRFEGPPRGLGFDVPSGERSSAGPLGLGPRGAFGHLGFTGCSLWLDLDRSLSVALLTNRTLHGRHRVEGIRALRPEVHRRIAEAV